jgi:hypothetical protein
MGLDSDNGDCCRNSDADANYSKYGRDVHRSLPVQAP